MDAALLARLIRGAAQTAGSLAELAETVLPTLTAGDQQELRGALDELSAQADQLHERLANKLARAAQS